MNELQMRARLWDGNRRREPILAGTRVCARSFEVHVAQLNSRKAMTRNTYVIALLGGLAAAAVAGVIVAATTSDRGPSAPDQRTSVEAPGTRVETGDGKTRVEAPFAKVEKDKDRVRVETPFVDVEVPKNREPSER